MADRTAGGAASEVVKAVLDVTPVDETPAPRAFVVHPGPMTTAPVDGERCCVCGSADVGYHNYRQQPFCWPCADGKGPHDARPAAVADQAGETLDLDAIRVHLAKADNIREAVASCTSAHDGEDVHEAQLMLALDVVGQYATALLAEVERLTRDHAELVTLAGSGPTLAELKAANSQMAVELEAALIQVAGRDEARAKVDGGEWGWQYGHELEVLDGWTFEPRGARYATSRRRWWMGPPERIAPGPVEAVGDGSGA